MHKTAQGIGSGRLVWIALLGTTALALAGCGGDDDSGAAGATAASTSSGTPATATDTSTAGTTTSTSGSTSSGSTPSTGSTSVTLNWEAPTENNNGSALTNLAGYKIHYGTASKDYTEVVAVSNPSLNRYVIDSLQSGTYYFAITAYNSAGVESPMSGEVVTTVD